MARVSSLTPIKQSQIVIALANGESRKSLASRFEVTEKTLIRWMESETFQREYKEAQQRLFDAGIAVLAEGAIEAAWQLRGIISDPGVPSAVKIRAIDILFKHAATASREQELIKAIEILTKEGLIPLEAARSITYKISSLGKDIVDSFGVKNQDENSKEKVLALIKAAVLGSPDDV